MLLLCNTQNYGQLTEEEFDLVADPNRCVNRFRFDLIINAMSKFFSYIGENTLHGPHLIASIIQECFEEVRILVEYRPGDILLQIKDVQFLFIHKTHILIPLESRHDRIERISIYRSLVATKYQILMLHKCISSCSSYQRVSKHCS